jgi:hypothetical protein
MTRSPLGIAPLLAALALVLAACASPVKIVQQWQEPGYAAPGFKRVLVIGVTRDAAVRRTFEDEFVAQLKARGIEAVPSYSVLPEDGQQPRERIEQAVRDARADAIILTRVLSREKVTEVVPAMAPPIYGGFYNYYGAYWGGPLYPGYAGPPAVYRYDEIRVESQLFDVRRETPVWTATSEVFAPDNPKRDSAEYARVMIEALAARKLL